MSIIKDNTESYKGAVIEISGRSWMDGMYSEYATVWNKDKKSFEHIEIGYYGCDGCNMMGDITAKVDCNIETARDIIRTTKQEAYTRFANSVTEYKHAIHKGDTVEVIRGRKIKKGTILSVFWVGEKPTYRATMSPAWSYNINETELIAGCKNENGEKVWIKAEYLKNLTPPKSPNAKERKKFIKDYIEKQVSFSIRNIAEQI